MTQFNLRQSPALVGICAFIICIVLLGWAFGTGCGSHGHALACRHEHAAGRRDLEFLVSIGAGVAAWAWARKA